MSWQAEARCRPDGPSTLPADAWLEGIGNTRAEQAAVRAAALRECQACPVRVVCLWTALANGEDDGLWGGQDLSRRHTLPARSVGYGRE